MRELVEQQAEISAGVLAVKEHKRRKQKFLNEVRDELFEAVHRIGGEGRGRAVQGQQRAAYYIDWWTTKGALNHPSQWKQNLRFASALRSGVTNGTIELSTDNDALAFSVLFAKSFSLMPQVIEHYADSGEVIELMSAVLLQEEKDEKEERERWLPGRKRKDFEDERLLFKVLRVYNYDMRLRGESGAQDDDESLMQLPLEVRLEFSGFYDPATAADESRYGEGGDDADVSIFSYAAYKRVGGRGAR